MPPALSDPVVIVMLCLLIGFVVGINLTLLGWLRGDRRVQAEASKWTRALRGGADARKTQADQLAELRQAVQRLEQSGEPDDERRAKPTS